MRKYLILPLLICFAGIFISCSDENSYPNNGVGTGFICNVNGVFWNSEPDLVYNNWAGTGENKPGVEFQLIGDTLKIFAISKKLNNPTAIIGCCILDHAEILGTYNLSYGGGGNYMMYVGLDEGFSFDENHEGSYVGYMGLEVLGIRPGYQTGSITITKFNGGSNRSISGTFWFDQKSSPDMDPALPTFEISEGVFTDIRI